MVFSMHQYESAIDIGRYACVPSVLKPLPPPSTSYPSRLFRAPALGALLHASNSHWLSILHMVMYMFQCYSLKSSHPLLLLSPKVCLCLLCCPACRIIGTIFLNSLYIYMLIDSICLSLTYFTLYYRLKVYLPH